MSVPRSLLCAAYALLALLALIATWSQNAAYLPMGFVGANLRFWQDTFANPASRSITVDLLFFVAAAAAWMLLEARRLGMRGAWLYLVLGVLVAISVTFPLFLLQRERTLARQDGSRAAGTLGAADAAGLLLFVAVACAYGVAGLLR